MITTPAKPVMKERPRPVRRIFYHGTSDVNMEGILKDGLCPRHSGKVFNRHNGDIWLRSNKTLGGVYFAVDPVSAYDQATVAAERCGGEPLLVQATIDEARALPDEDRIPVDTLVRWVLDWLDMGYDSDWFAKFRKRYTRGGVVRDQVRAALHDFHELRLYADPKGNVPFALLERLLLASVDRMLAYLGDNPYVMEELGKTAQKRMPFPIPPARDDIEAQEDRLQELLHEMCVAYPHLAWQSTYRAAPIEQCLRVVDGIGFDGEDRITAVLRKAGDDLQVEWGELEDDSNLERFKARSITLHEALLLQKPA